MKRENEVIMTTKEKLKKAISKTKSGLIILQDNCSIYCNREKAALSEWLESHQKAEKALVDFYDLIQEPIFRERIANIEVDSKNETDDPKASFDKIMYFISRLNGVTQPPYVLKWNKHYCYKVLLVIAKEYSAIKKYLSDIKEQKERETEKKCNLMLQDCQIERKKLWSQLVDDTIDALARERLEQIITDCSRA